MAYTKRGQEDSSNYVKKDELKDGFISILKLLLFIFAGYFVLWLAGAGSRLSPPNKPFSNPKTTLGFTGVEISVYNPTKLQTDSTPLHTFCGDTIVLKDSTLQNWVAISPDLFKDLNLSCQDSVTLYCECPYDGIKFKVVDKTHSKIKYRVDVLEHGNVSTGLYPGLLKSNCKE